MSKYKTTMTDMLFPLGIMTIIGATVGTIFCTSRDQKINDQQRIHAQVLEESYIDGNRIVKSPEVDGLVSYSGETVKLSEPKYILKLRTNEGRDIYLNVIDSASVQKEALEKLIEEGSRISFPMGNLVHGGFLHDIEQTNFGEGTQIGTKRAGTIRVE